MQNKRIIAVFIMLIFCAALAIGGSAVFTIAEVEASYTLISNEQKSKVSDIDALLNGFEGENIMLLKESEISKVLEGYTYLKISEIKKVYPNSLIVKITERKELFAVMSGQKYTMLDIDGFVLSEKGLNQNNIDNQPNIIIEAEGNFTVGSYSNPSDITLFNCILDIAKLTDAHLKANKENDNIRNSVLKISIVNGMNINLTMAEGLIISITDAAVKTTDKLISALNVYTNTLSPEKKAALNAKLLTYIKDGKVNTDYSYQNKY